MTHDHAPGRDADRRLLLGALGLILAFMAVEVVVGLLIDSLALLADAGHMLTDAAAIGLALVAIRLAARPASGAYTYGLKRAEILSAQINGLTLAVLVVVFVVEAVRRLIHPPEVDGGAWPWSPPSGSWSTSARPPCWRGPTGAASTSPGPSGTSSPTWSRSSRRWSPGSSST